MGAEKPDILNAPMALVNHHSFSAWARSAAILVVAIGIAALIGVGLNAAHEVDP